MNAKMASEESETILEEVILFSPIKLSSNSTICVFCLKKQSEIIRHEKASLEPQKLLKRFLQLSQRYIGNRNHFSSSFTEVVKWFVQNEIGECEYLKSKLAACEDCSLLLQDFCDIYNKIKILEIKLNWKLDTLQSIMRTANKVWFRIKDLQDTCGMNHFNEVQQFRTELARKAARKILKSKYPKVVLSKIQPENETRACPEKFECNDNEDKNLPVGHEDQNKTKSETAVDLNSSVDISEPFKWKQQPAVEEEEEANEFDTLENAIREDNCSQPPATLPLESPSKTLCKSEGNQAKDNLESTEIHLECLEVSIQTNVRTRDASNEISGHEDTTTITSNSISTSEQSLVCQQKQENVREMEVDTEGISDGHDTSTVDVSSPFVTEYDSPLDQTYGSVQNDSISKSNKKPIPTEPSDKDEIAEKRGNIALVNENDVGFVSPKIKKEPNSIDEAKCAYASSPAFRRSTRKCIGKGQEISTTATKDLQDRKIKKNATSSKLNASQRKTKVRRKHPPLKVTVERVDDFTSLKQLALKKVMSLRFTCDIPPCKSLTFINSRDLQHHQLHHGNFKCNICDVIENFALDLSDHELLKHSHVLSEEGKGRKCSRCDFCGTDSYQEVVDHHLKSHLNLIVDKHTCTICELRIQITEDGGSEHYKKFHDLTNINYHCIKKCDTENCQAYFRTPQQLFTHKRFVHGLTKDLSEKKFYCKSCEKYFSKKRQLQLHQETQHLIKKKAARVGRVTKHYCRECDRYFVENRNLKDHKNSKHSGSIMWIQSLNLSPAAIKLIKLPVFCKIPKCRKEFYNEVDLKNHSKLHGEFKCNFCDDVVTYARDLLVHEATHSTEAETKSLLTCTRCDYSIEDFKSIRTTPLLVEKHFVESHLNLAMDHYTCHLCQRTLQDGNQRRNFYSHYKTMHDFSKTIYSCNESGCDVYFNSKFSLQVHKNDHKKKTVVFVEESDGTKRVQCKHCGTTFRSLECLKVHVKNMHINIDLEDTAPRNISDKTFPCKECDRSFSSMSSLRKHYRVHDANRKPERPWICETCGKSFKLELRLKLHLLSHTGPETWEFVCSECGKRCLTEQKLEEHQRTHTKEKPFSCEICGISYAHRHNLRIHINSKHSDVTTDPARRIDTSHFASRKGIKRKLTTENGEKSSKSKQSRPRRRRQQSSSTDASTNDSETDNSSE